MKAYGVMLCCLSKKALKILATTGYSTEQFLVAYRKFIGNQGSPAVVISDHGSQLLSAAKKQADPEAQDIKWEEIVGLAGRSGTKWTFTERGSPWRNGTAEAMVKLAKETLGHQLQSHLSLDWSELDSLFSQVADIINNRPLGVFHSEEDYHQICPNDLLLGRSHKPTGEPNLLDDPEVDIKKILSAREELVQRWWKEWERKVFPTLLPRKKWHHQSRNVQVGDIVLVQYKGRIKTVWKLGKVSDVFPDKHSFVRTVEVELRGRNKREKPLPYRYQPPLKLRLAVQRLCVLLPVEEQVQKGGPVKDASSVEDVDKDIGLIEETCQEKTPKFPATKAIQGKKLSKIEKQNRRNKLREPRRFSKRLAGFSASLSVVNNLEYYLSSDEDLES